MPERPAGDDGGDSPSNLDRNEDDPTGTAPLEALEDHRVRVTYGRVVNLLSTLADDLEREGATVTEAQIRLILKRMRSEAPDRRSGRVHDLSRLARACADTLGLDVDHVVSKLLEAVELEAL